MNLTKMTDNLVMSEYASGQMKHIGIGGGGGFGLREFMKSGYDVDLDTYDILGPIYDDGDYQPVVTGKAKVGEATETAMRREVAEELGLDNITLVPLPANPKYPKWTFAASIDGRASTSTTPQSTLRDDYNRRVMVLVLIRKTEEIVLTPVNDEGIHRVLRVPSENLL